MDCPTKILDSLIDPWEVFSSFIGAKTIVFHFQTPQDAHTRFGQRIVFDIFVLEKGCHPVKMLLQKADHSVKRRIA